MNSFLRLSTRLSLFIFGCFILGSAQSPDPSNWETLRPEGEEFSALMPKGAAFESGKELYHKMELNSRMYISRNPAGSVFGIVSLSGIKSNPAAYTEMQRMNSYVDAFKQLFSAKIKGKDPAVVKLNLLGDKKLNGHLGREYKLSIGDLSGIANVYATRRRFYAIVYLDKKFDNGIKEQFISSFTLPDKVADPPPTVAQSPVQEAPAPKPAVKANGETESSPDETGETKPEVGGAAADPDQKKRPVSGGVLNGKALSLPKPNYPAEALQAGISGTVQVSVTIDEAGTVISARAVTGHPLLQQAAVEAALQARFSPTMLLGEPVKVRGILTYNFVKP